MQTPRLSLLDMASIQIILLSHYTSFAALPFITERECESSEIVTGLHRSLTLRIRNGRHAIYGRSVRDGANGAAWPAALQQHRCVATLVLSVNCGDSRMRAAEQMAPKPFLYTATDVAQSCGRIQRISFGQRGTTMHAIRSARASMGPRHFVRANVLTRTAQSPFRTATLRLCRLA